METNFTMKDVVNLSQSRWFVYAWSDIYWGLANSWDYGPYWSLLKENIKNLWIKEFVQKRDDVVLLDAAILMNPQTWVASWHVGWFSDPLMECKDCHTRHRADKLIEAKIDLDSNCVLPNNWAGDKTTNEDLNEYAKAWYLECPNCNSKDFAPVVRFNLMLKTYLWVNEDNASLSYLRPETAQGIFVDFPHILRTSRKKIPFWVAQCWKAFRNEITPWNFIFRTREFEQIEIEYFCEPGTDEANFALWLDEETRFFDEVLGFKWKTRFVEIPKEWLPHYSKRAGDFEFLFPFGWWEISTLANRTDYDLKAHLSLSKADMSYFDPFTNRKYIPYVIEPSIWLSRLVLASICNAYKTEELEDWQTRNYLAFPAKVAPIKVWVLPVIKKLSEIAKNIYKQLSEDFVCEYDEVWSVGKRYARFDEIGTPFCITIDSENYEAWKVTIRYRDTMEQELININDLNNFLQEKLR